MYVQEWELVLYFFLSYLPLVFASSLCLDVFLLSLCLCRPFKPSLSNFLPTSVCLVGGKKLCPISCERCVCGVKNVQFLADGEFVG